MKRSRDKRKRSRLSLTLTCLSWSNRRRTRMDSDTTTMVAIITIARASCTECASLSSSRRVANNSWQRRSLQRKQRETQSLFSSKYSSAKLTGPTPCNKNRLCQTLVAKTTLIEMPIELDILHLRGYKRLHRQLKHY